MKRLKEQKGITLVALVITIIVLLILAGVALNLVLGEDGITNRAVNAGKTQNIAGAKEKLELDVANYGAEFYQAKYVNNDTNATSIQEYIMSKFAGRYSPETSGAYEDTFILSVDTEHNKLTLTSNINSDNSTNVTATIGDDGKVSWSAIDYADSTSGGGSTTGVNITKVGDGSVASATAGEEVTIGTEHFYVIANDSTTLTLLAKYNLATTPNSTTGKYEQQNANYETTACAFSSTNYWLDTWNSKSTTAEKRLNLNIEPTIPTEGDNAQSVSNNAILRAREYGRNLGVTGRLLTYDEANTLKSTMSTIIYGKYTGDEKVGTDGWLLYWLGSASGNSSAFVWYVSGDNSGLISNSCSGSSSTGVRPVLEVLKSQIQ